MATDEEMLSLLFQRLEAESAMGHVTPERASQLRDVVLRAKQALSVTKGDLPAMQRSAALFREAMRLAADFALTPSWRQEAPVHGSRAQQAFDILGGLRKRVLAEKLVAMLPSEESAVATDLMHRVATLEARIRELCDQDDHVARVDGDVWRLAADVQAYLCRYNLMLAHPIFRTRREIANQRSVFLSGEHDLAAAASLLEQRGEMVIHGTVRSGDHSEQRWNALLSATIAVFDVGVRDTLTRAQVCYELGLALAIGKPCVIVVRDRTEIPFDVDPTLHVLTENAAPDSQMMLEAIGETLANPRWGGAEGGLGDRPSRTLDWLKKRVGHRLMEGTTAVALRLAENQSHYAVSFRGALDQLLGMLGADAPLVLLPAWPAEYPDRERSPQLFHVMPFRPKWASRTRDMARSACEQRGWDYRRGDESTEQRITRAIWAEIASASAVLVDITGCNPNVALELGMAHAVGRHTWVIAQGESSAFRFLSIEKIQVHRYDPDAGDHGFRECVWGLIDSADSALRRT